MFYFFTYVLTSVNFILYLCLTYALRRPTNSTCDIIIIIRDYNGSKIW